MTGRRAQTQTWWLHWRSRRRTPRMSLMSEPKLSCWSSPSRFVHTPLPPIAGRFTSPCLQHSIVVNSSLFMSRVLKRSYMSCNIVKPDLSVWKPCYIRPKIVLWQIFCLCLCAQGLNAALFYENKDPRTFVSLVPTSAHSGDGMGNLIGLLVELTQTMLARRLAHCDELRAQVMEVRMKSVKKCQCPCK